MASPHDTPTGMGGSVTDDREPGDPSVQGTKPYQRAALVSFTLAARYSPGSDTARDRHTDLRVRDVCEKYIKCKSVFAQPLVTIQPKWRPRGARRCWRLWVPQGAWFGWRCQAAGCSLTQQAPKDGFGSWQALPLRKYDSLLMKICSH